MSDFLLEPKLTDTMIAPPRYYERLETLLEKIANQLKVQTVGGLKIISSAYMPNNQAWIFGSNGELAHIIRIEE